MLIELNSNTLHGNSAVTDDTDNRKLHLIVTDTWTRLGPPFVICGASEMFPSITL